MKRLSVLVLALAVAAGCRRPAEESPAPATPVKKPEAGTVKTPEPVKDPVKPADQPPDKPADAPKIQRKVTHPEKKGLLATFKCQCTGNSWTQPAEEEKLCIEYCKGEMPECGELLKEEPAPK